MKVEGVRGTLELGGRRTHFTTAQVAKLVGASRNTLYRWLYQGRIPRGRVKMLGKVRVREFSRQQVRKIAEFRHKNEQRHGGHAAGENERQFCERLGKRIQVLRRSAGYSLTEMHNASGFHSEYFKRVEAGAPIRINSLLRICGFFHVSVSQLTEGLDKGMYEIQKEDRRWLKAREQVVHAQEQLTRARATLAETAKARAVSRLRSVGSAPARTSP